MIPFILDVNSLHVNNKYFYLTSHKNPKFRSTDIIILSKIDEFYRHNVDCYIQDDTWCELTGMSRTGVRNSIDKLVRHGLVDRFTFYEGGKGSKRGKIRKITLNEQGIENFLNSINENHKVIWTRW